jgi:hypothetical protein
MATGSHGYHDCPAKLISFPMGFFEEPEAFAVGKPSIYFSTQKIVSP